MIDLKYYVNSVLSEHQDSDLLIKRYSHYKFKNLYGMKTFFENIVDSRNFSQIEDEKEKEKIIQLSNAFSLTLDFLVVDTDGFLKDEVYPKLNFSDVLYDLNPSVSGANIMVDCPCCSDTAKKTDKAYIVKIGNENTTSIQCNRLKACGKTTSVIKHIGNREGLDFLDSVRYLGDSVGVDYDLYVRNKEMHIEDNGIFRDKDYTCDAKEIEKKKVEKKVSNVYGFGDIDFKKADTSKEFKNQINTMKLLYRYDSLSESGKVQLIYSYIRNFTLKEKNREDLYSYLNNRGINKDKCHDVGYLKASQINILVRELKEIFNVNDLVKYKILNEKTKSWNYKLITKDEKYVYCDSAVFFMHDIYTDIPTNIEFKFFGDATIGSPRKAVSMSNSHLVDSNYYGSANNIDYIKKDNQSKLSERQCWWTEGAIDSKVLEYLDIKSNGLIGAGKHFNENIGWFKDKIHIIALDEDDAGSKNSVILAKKLKMSGAKHIFFACWDDTFGNDINDLLVSRNLDKVKLAYCEFGLDKEKKITVSSLISDVQKLNVNQINKAYEIAFKDKCETVAQIFNVSEVINFDSKEEISKKKESIEEEENAPSISL